MWIGCNRASFPSLELIDRLTHTSLESVPAHLSFEPPAHSLESLVKSTNDYVIADPTMTLALWILKKSNLRGGQMSLIGP